MNDTRTDPNTSSESIRGVVQHLRNVTPQWYSADLLEAVTAQRDKLADELIEAERKLRLCATPAQPSSPTSTLLELLRHAVVGGPPVPPVAPPPPPPPSHRASPIFQEILAERDTVARRAGELELKVKDLAKKVTSHAMLLDEAHEALCRCADGFDAILKLAASIDKVAPRAGEGGGLLTLPGHARAVSASIRKALE